MTAAVPEFPAKRLPDAIKRLIRGTEIYTYAAHDETPLTMVAFEPECPLDEIHAVNGVVLVGHVLARRLPSATGTITHKRGNVPCWKLEDLEAGQTAPGTQ